MQPQDPLALDRPGVDRRTAPLDAAAVVEQIRSGEIETVIVGGCDLGGVFRAKRIASTRFPSSAEPTLRIAEHIFMIDVDNRPQPKPAGYEGRWPGQETGYTDIHAVADLETMRPVPWLERTAIVLCDYRFTDGSEYEIAPRNVLGRVVERYEALGLEPRMAPELEFVVLRESEHSAAQKGFRNLEPLFEKVVSFGSVQATVDSALLSRIIAALEAMRIPIEAWNPEGAPGQYELNTSHAPALEAADRGFLLKQAAKEVCALEGMTATFMAKLAADAAGSSLHVHQSLWREGESAFYDPDAADGLSPLLRHFIAGQVRTLIEFAPIWMPTPASFKRSAPYMGVGTSESWGADNRTLSLRVLAEDARQARVEHRVAGADANVYLAMAAMLAGGLYGIENELEPPAATRGDAHADAGLRTQPPTLEAALGAFEQSEVANAYLGEEFVRRYAATRRWEEEEARRQVTDWELRRYLARS